jgi:hypothetical protein
MYLAFRKCYNELAGEIICKEKLMQMTKFISSHKRKDKRCTVPI